MQIYKRLEEEEKQVQSCFCNILARQYENFKILVPSPHNTLSFVGVRDKIKLLFKFNINGRNANI